MEKRRRARINNCLNELKALILDAMKKDVRYLLFLLFSSCAYYEQVAYLKKQKTTREDAIVFFLFRNMKERSIFNFISTYKSFKPL